MRPTVFGITLAALLFVISQAGPKTSRGYNDLHGGQGYAHCDSYNAEDPQDPLGDHHHTQWYYTDYSENWLPIYNKLAYGMDEDYVEAFQYAQVYWNAQGTRVLLYSSSTTGSNVWTTYWAVDQLTGHTDISCYHSGDPHQIVYSYVFLNRKYLDASEARRRTVALHEVGHELGLGHSTRTIGGNPIGVMWTPTSDHDFQAPQADDVCGVNSMYRSNTYSVNVPPCHSDH